MLINKKMNVCLIVLFSLFSVQAQSANMKPLNEVINQEQSAPIKIYTAQRCAGLFNAIYAELAAQKSEAAQNAAAKLLMMAADATMLAGDIAKNSRSDLTTESAMKVALRIAQKYKELMTDSYDRTGNVFSEFILKDQDFCISFLESQAGLKVENADTSDKSEPVPEDILVGNDTLEEQVIAKDNRCVLNRLTALTIGGGVEESIGVVIDDSGGLILFLKANLILDDQGNFVPFSGFEGSFKTTLSEWMQVPDSQGLLAFSGSKPISFLVSIVESDKLFLKYLMSNDLKLDFGNHTMVGFNTQTGPKKWVIGFGPKSKEFFSCFEDLKPKIRHLYSK